MLDFELKIFRHVTCQILKKMFTSKKSRFGSFYLVKTAIFAFSRFFIKHDFELKISLSVRFSIQKKYNASDMELKKNAPDFGMKKNNASDFEIQFVRLVRFCVKTLQRVRF